MSYNLINSCCATYCQLMHILFPTSIDLSSVRFESDSIEDYRHNYSLLQKAFDQVGVLRYIPVNDLIHKNEAACLQFLRWFKVFFIKNDKHRTQAHGNALRLPISSGVVDVITKVVPPKPVQPVEEAEKLGKDSLKPNDVVLKSTNEDKQKEEDTQTIANEAPVENVNQKTLKTLELSEDQDSQPVTPAKDAEELRRDCLNTSDNNLNSPNQDKLVEDKISNVTPVEKITQHTSNPLVTLKTFINQNFTQTTNSKCTASISSTSNNLMLVCSQPLYYLYLNVAPVNQAKQATMSTMKTNDIILISDNEDKPDEGKPIMVTNGTPLENINEKTLLPLKSAVTNTQSSLHLSSQPKTHPKDLKEACSQSPYCLYVDMGLELNEKVCSALIGYCDQLSGASVVKMLDTLYITENSADEIPIPVITKHTASAAADRLISLLKKSELPLNNLAVFYCNVPDPEVNWMITLKLKEFNPHLVSLGALGCIAGSACQIGLMSCYSHVVDLINDIQYFKLPSSFTETNYNPMFSVSLQYSATINIIQKIAVHWEELVEFFKAMNTKVGSNRGLLILNKLQEPKFKLEFMFLSHALEPLRAFRGLQKNKTRDMVVELQMTTMLISAYATSILPPSAAEEFLRNKDLEMLFSLKELLPMSNINVGFQARKFLVTQSFAELGEEMRSKFLTQAVSFYQTMLKISVESLPGQLTPVTIKNIGTLLKHPKNLMSNEISSKQLTELANQLGVCKTDASISQLASEYVNYIQKANQGQKKNEAKEEEGEGHWWVKVLDSLEQFPLLHELILTLLAFPRSLQMKQVFNKPQQTHVSPRSPRRQKGRKWKFLSHRSEKVELISSDEEDYSQSKPKQPSSNIVATMNREKHSEESECTDNSSDVVDVTEECKFKLSLYPNIGSKVTEKSESIYMLDRGESKSKPPSVTPSQTPAAQGQQGELVLIHLEASVSWPGVTVPSLEDKQEPDMKKVQWYGHSMTSEVCIEYLRPFRDFARCFCQNTFATVAAYKEAVFLSLREASARCQKHFYLSNDEKNNKEKILMEMLDWAFGGFKPTGPSGFEPVGCENPEDTLAPFQVSTTVNIQGKVQPEDLPKVSVSLYKINTNSFQTSDKVGGVDSAEKSVKKKSKTGWKGGKGSRKKSPLLEDLDDNDSSPDFVPYKKRAYTKSDQQNKNNTQTREYAQPDQKVRERIISKIMELKLDIDGFCLCCGTEDVVIFHPLFQGSLCSECKGNFAETLYRYDEDGYQSYCTICCYGNEVLLCGNDSCCRSFCADCLNILVCQGTFDSLKLLDPWICYLCQPHQTHGALTPREDWSIRVQELFANNSAMEFEPHRVYPSIPANLRRPLRVLSLFDGIATGYLVLKELGFKVEKYVASEVCEDSLAVANVNHDGKIIHVGDAKFITQDDLKQWGPFDLLIGGSPCNDLSIVNPLRKGLYEGTGRLFFEYYRILHLLKPKEDDPRPFFWLFENVVFMNTHDRVNICRFLECNPVLVDAVKVSPANRARYFWGNIPGMSRPITASKTDKLNLQDCLEVGRLARMTKVRTITTNSNSLKQGKNVARLPVLQTGIEDTLWITEIEKIFGFPKHYTDVRNMNRQQRQKVLGKAWSVPVIRHLFAPLKDYFACEELPPISTSNNPSTSGSSPSSLSNSDRET